MKVVAIIQARMGSRRLPGKVLRQIGGRSMLARVVGRTRRARTVGEVVVATTVLPQDDPVAAQARELGVEAFRGDPELVLDRYYAAAKAHGAEVIVRITGDCPLIEPEIVDRVVRAFLEAWPSVDCAANTLDRTYPRGLDVEVASFAALERIWREASEPFQRWHVFPYLFDRRERFRVISVRDETDRSWMRWTVDTPQDLAFVRAVYAQLDHRDDVHWREVLELLERVPRLLLMNAEVQQKPVEAS